jgi:hypothetical protein
METAKSCRSPAVRKDGTRISVEFTIVPFSNDSGQMIGIAAIMRDTTTRFEELRALRRQLAVHPAATGTESKKFPIMTVPASGSHETRRWREPDSNARSPCKRDNSFDAARSRA